MYLSRLVLNGNDRAVRRDLRDCHELHRTIMRAFPAVEEGAPRQRLGILFRVEPRQATRDAVVLVQSTRKPDWSALPEGYARAVADRPIDARHVRRGAVLRFRLRANVTKKVDTKTGPDGKRRHGRRVPLAGDESRVAWLRSRAARGGFEIVPIPEENDVRVTEEANVLGKRGVLAFGSVLFEGRLRIVDLELFRKALAEGVGPAKAFGFGLLSVPQ